MPAPTRVGSTYSAINSPTFGRPLSRHRPVVAKPRIADPSTATKVYGIRNPMRPKVYRSSNASGVRPSRKSWAMSPRYTDRHDHTCRQATS